MTDTAAQDTQDDALVRAITLQMEVDELKAGVQQLKKEAQQAPLCVNLNPYTGSVS